MQLRITRKIIKNKLVYIAILSICTGYIFNVFLSKVYAGNWTTFAPQNVNGYIDGAVVTNNASSVTGSPDTKLTTLSCSSTDDITTTGYSLDGTGTINSITFTYLIAVQGEFANIEPDNWELLFSTDGGLVWFPAREASSQLLPDLTSLTFNADYNPVEGRPWMWTDLPNLQLQLKRSVVGSVDNIRVMADSFYITINYVDDDSTPPQQILHSPGDDETDVPVDSSIVVAFDEAINEATLNDSTVILYEDVYNAVYDSDNYIDVDLSYDKDFYELVVKPVRPLKYNTSYVMRLTAGIQDPAGNPLIEHNWSFITEKDPDPPFVEGVYPEEETIDIGIASNIAVTFSEPMDPNTLNGGSITVTETVYGCVYSNLIPGMVTYNSCTDTASFIPDTNYAPNATISVSLRETVADLSGNFLGASKTWRFYTVSDFVYAPSPPSGVVARGLGKDSVGVSWQQVNTAVGYTVYRSTESGGPFSEIYSTYGQAQTYFVDTGLQPNTAYYYKVAAFNDVGYSSLSENFIKTYTNWNGTSITDYTNKGITTPLEAPVGVSVYNGDWQVTINWQTVNDPLLRGYNVYRGDLSGGPYEKVNPIELDTMMNTFVDITVYNYQTYFYRVVAVDVHGVEGEKSQELWARPEGAPIPGAPHIDPEKDNNLCAICHITHNGFGEKLINQRSVQVLCLTCHDGASSSSDLQREQVNSLTNHTLYPDEMGSLKCTGCHEPRLDSQVLNADGSQRYPKILMNSYKGRENFRGNAICYNCHGEHSELTTGDIASMFEQGVHKEVLPLPESGTEIQCTNCHRPHVSPNDRLLIYNRVNLCLGCHNRGLSASLDPKKSHDLGNESQLETGAVITCANCHNPHGVRKDAKLSDPEKPNIQMTGKVSSFCIKCHDGSFPAVDKTMPYALGVVPPENILVNVAETFYYRFDGKATAHGEDSGGGEVQDTVFGYGAYPFQPSRTLNCLDCHEPHGSDNAFHLKTQRSSADGLVIKNGLFIYSWNYLDDGRKSTGADARLFCSSCHGQGFMGNDKPFPTNCFTTNCHGHGEKF